MLTYTVTLNLNDIPKIWMSSWCKKWVSAGSIMFIFAKSLLRHKLDINHTMLRRSDTWNCALSWHFFSFFYHIRFSGTGCSFSSIFRSASAAPNIKTMSQVTVLSPAIFPSAHTEWSATFLSFDCNKCTNFGTASARTTAIVCSDDPDAIFVRIQAASIWNS